MVNNQLDLMFDNWIKQRNMDRKRRRKLHFAQLKQIFQTQID